MIVVAILAYAALTELTKEDEEAIKALKVVLKYISDFSKDSLMLGMAQS